MTSIGNGLAAAHAASREYLQDVLVRSLAEPTPATDRGEADPALQAFLSGFVVDELRALGADVAAPDAIGNVFGRMPGGGGKSNLFVIFGETYPAGTMEDPWKPQVSDGSAFSIPGVVVRGRGACEQRGPMASVFAAMRAVKAAKVVPKGDILVLCLESGELGRHTAIASAMQSFSVSAQSAIVGVCTGNNIVLGHKGRADVAISVLGRAARSRNPWLGINAAEGASELVQRLVAMDLGNEHPDLGRRTITVTRLRTVSDAAHTVPAACEVMVDYRLLPGDKPVQAVESVRNVARTISGYHFEIEAGDYMYPGAVSADSEIVALLIEGARAIGRTPGLQYMSAAADTGYLNEHGIPAVCFGPGDAARAHTDDDVVSLDEAMEAAQILAYAMVAGSPPTNAHL